MEPEVKKKLKFGCLIFVLLFTSCSVTAVSTCTQKINGGPGTGHAYPAATPYLEKLTFLSISVPLTIRLFNLDERGPVMRPVVNLMRSYAEEASKQIPDDDAEKELYWEMANWPVMNATAGGTVYYPTYPPEEIRENLDQIAKILDAIMVKKTRSDFFEVRKYATTFDLLTTMFDNHWLYHYDPKTKKTDQEALFLDPKLADRYRRLVEYMRIREYVYSKNHPALINEYALTRNFCIYLAARHVMMNQIYRHESSAQICDVKTNNYLMWFLESREVLVRAAANSSVTKRTKTTLMPRYVTKEQEQDITAYCPNINLEEVKYVYSR